MKKINRFGVSMEEQLLHRFDRLIAEKGYTNRSEAIRDIVRDKLVEEDIQQTTGTVYGTLTFVYDHYKRELEKKLSSVQHDYHHNIVATTHVHISHSRCLEAVILKGEAKILRTIADHLLSIKGVQHGKLTITTSMEIL
jgi:CopG family nickel-responsive transcriptional regulator